jgi:hypothetical protein
MRSFYASPRASWRRYSATVPPAELWPSNLLGAKLRASGAMIPADMVDRIRALPAGAIADAIGSVAAILGTAFSWTESAVAALSFRQGKLAELTQGVWG